MNRRRPVRFDLRKSFFFDRRHDDLIPLRPRRIQHEKRKLAVAGDQAKFLV